MIGARLKKFQKKLRKSREKTHDLYTATLARWQNLVTFAALVPPAVEARKKRLVLLAHYSACDRVHAYVLALIEALQQADCDVVLISTAETLDQADIASLISRNVSVIVRRNIGYDFGSWRIALDVYPEMKKDYATIIFANDSVYGPLHDIDRVLNTMEQCDFDVWALTVSYERSRHLQTFFWAMTGRSVESGFFDYFWRRYYRFYSRRQTVIDRYEMKIADIAEQKFGLKVGGYWDVADMPASALESDAIPLRKFNPMRDFWFELLMRYQFPFIKRELFKKHARNTAEFQRIATTVKSIDPTAWKLVEEHLSSQSVTRPHSPVSAAINDKSIHAER